MAETKSSVPAVIDSRAKLAPVHTPALSYIGEGEGKQASLSLSSCMWAIRHHCWKILFFVGLCALVTLILSKRLTPVYESTATIDVDRQMPRGGVGQDAVRQSLDDTDQFLATQMKLIQSDSVLRRVALKYDLRNREQQDTAVANRSVADRAEAPVLLKELKVTRPPKTYLLQISYRSTNPHLAADVANAIATSYIDHAYDIRVRSLTGLSSMMEKQLQELKATMEKSKLVLARFEHDPSVANAEEQIKVQSARLLQLNTEYTNAQADRVAKEAAYNAAKTGSLEAAEALNQGNAVNRLTERLNEANGKFTNIKAKFGTDQPEYRRAAAVVSQLTNQLDRTRRNIGKRMQAEYLQAIGRERTLGKEVAAMKAKLDRINSRSLEYKSLQREAEVDKRLYEELVQKLRETGINAGFQGDAIRLADSARPALRPVFPNVRLNVLLASLFATILAIAVAIVSDLMDTTVRDPEQAHGMFNTDVIGVLPVARSRRTFLAASEEKSGALMRWQDASDKRVAGYVEAIRTLRNSITINNMDRRLKSILITSAAAMEGKSATAVHLALAHADQRHKTLLIDCNLRRPSIHRYFDVSNSVGVANVITGGMPWRDAVARVDETPQLHLLLSGPLTRTAPDLLGKEIGSIIVEAEKEYGLVVVDAPPLLGFAETLQIASYVGGVVVVTVAGQTHRRAVASVLNALNRLRIHVTGIVLNKLDISTSGGYCYHGYYGRDAQLKRG